MSKWPSLGFEAQDGCLCWLFMFPVFCSIFSCGFQCFINHRTTIHRINITKDNATVESFDIVFVLNIIDTTVQIRFYNFKGDAKHELKMSQQLIIITSVNQGFGYNAFP